MPRRTAAAAVLLASLVAVLPAPAALVAAPVHGAVVDDGGPTADDAMAPDDGVLSVAQSVVPAQRRSAPKSLSAQLAATDPELLGRTDDALLDVLVKLDYDSFSTYAGDVEGLAATSPSVTGEQLSGASAAEQAYAEYLDGLEASFATALAEAVPAASVIGSPLRTVFGGVHARVPANQISAALAIDGVAAIQSNSPRQPLTDASGSFIGADAISTEAAPGLAGAGVVVAVLDSGVWPEHPMFAVADGMPPAPTQPDGTPLPCEFGDNPLTEQVDPFTCNSKVVTGQVFLDAYRASRRVTLGERFLDSARDGAGHGTHVASTAVGSRVERASVFDVERGPLSGVAPGAALAVYKVCGDGGCFPSDALRAIERAISDGVDVINYSITGGSDPRTDPVEMAFLDAYAAGVFVTTSAGNKGAEPGEVNHRAPWVTTVGASSQARAFGNELIVTTAEGTEVRFSGASVTRGTDGAAPIRRAGAVEGYGDEDCLNPAPAGSLDGLIVVCARGTIARVTKSFNVAQGGAVGMVLYNRDEDNVSTDNHWLPTVHLVDGSALLTLLDAAPTATATITAGRAQPGTPDVVGDFSSRGPGGPTIKPDLVAPGVAILAGTSPASAGPNRGVSGSYWWVSDGTSMASPHVAGAAALLLATHDGWTPGQVRSALMTTATTALTVSDGGSATPFDRGAGRITLGAAVEPGLTFDATADDMVRFGLGDPEDVIHLNVPSVNATSVPGRVKTTRTAVNTTDRPLSYSVSTTAPGRSRIIVTPSEFTVEPGTAVELTIVIDSVDPTEQYFGEIALTPVNPGVPELRLPVAFIPRQGEVRLDTVCTPDRISLGGRSTCVVTATNNSGRSVTVDLSARSTSRLDIVAADGEVDSRGVVVHKRVELSPFVPASMSIAPADGAGYRPLDGFTTPISIGDEDIIDFDVPEFVFGGVTYDTIGVASNGYAVLGPTTSADIECCEFTVPSPMRPNNVLAPFWTDLDGSNATGIYAVVLTNGNNEFWFAVEWRLNVFGTDSERRFQMWVGLNGEEDVRFAYDPERLPADPDGKPLVIGVEDATGRVGATLAPGELPTGTLRVRTVLATAGGQFRFGVTLEGVRSGNGVVATTLRSPALVGTAINRELIVVGRR